MTYDEFVSIENRRYYIERNGKLKLLTVADMTDDEIKRQATIHDLASSSFAKSSKT